MTEAERLYVIPFSDSLQMYVLACHFQLEAEVAIAAEQFFKIKVRDQYVNKLKDVSSRVCYRLLLNAP